jgi:hypothetical protein
MNASHDWFKHDDGRKTEQPWPPGPDQLPPAKVHRQRRNDEAKRQMMTGHDPNEWYRHEHGPNDSPDGATVESPTRHGKKQVQSSAEKCKGHVGTTVSAVGADGAGGTLWFAHDGRQPRGAADGTEKNGDASLHSPRHRHTAPEADAYYNRDKIGSGSDWFPHEHPATTDDHQPPASSVSTPRTATAGPHRESEEIARRLKVESEDWFSHDASTAPAAALPPSPSRGQGSRCGVGGGKTLEVQKMLARDSGDEVRQILRVDDNVRAAAAEATSPR